MQHKFMKLNQITFTRFLAAISIVIFHYGQKLPFYTNDTISFIFKKAYLGVSYFFILSGFIMIIAYHNKGKLNFGDYLSNRFARIYPMYLLALILFVFLTNSFSVTDIVLNIFALQAWVPLKVLVLNSPGWSISVEFFFYLIFPFLINYFYKLKPSITFTIVLLLWLFSQIFLQYFIQSIYYTEYTKSHNFVYYFPLMHLSQFLIGNLAGIIFINKMKSKNYDIPIIILILLFLICLKFVPLDFHNGLLALLFVPLILLISANTGSLTQLFNKKPLVYLGEISFAIYILQVPIHIAFDKIIIALDLDLNDSLYFTLYVFSLLIFSMICFKYVEKPLRNYLKKNKSRATSHKI